MGNSNSKSEFSELEEIKNWIKTNQNNKSKVKWLVFFSLLLSFVLLGLCVYKSNDISSKIENKTETQFKQHISCAQNSDTITCKNLSVTKNEPIKIIEEDYSMLPYVFLYISVLVVVSLFLWGTFKALFMVLKSENDLNSKIRDVRMDIYKENQMWELTKLKNDFEANNKQNSEKDNKLKDKIEEFEKIEKVKLDMKYKHDQRLKDKENLQVLVSKNANSNLSELKEILINDGPTNNRRLDRSK